MVSAWLSKAKLGLAAASIVSAYHTALLSANYPLRRPQAHKKQVRRPATQIPP